MGMTEDKNDEHWLITLILQIKINSMPYIIKALIFVMIVVIIHWFSDGEVAKVLSVITYTAGMTIDSYYLSKNCITDSKKLEAFLFIHTIIVVAGTFGAVILLLKISVDNNFVASVGYKMGDFGINLFLLYATITPLLEAIINSNGNQLINKREEEEKE